MQEIKSKSGVPFIEKYRPTNFDDIVLDNINKRIFKNIITKNYFPNLLLFGSPGVGKTTTATNLINEYQKNNKINNKGNVIHLNASDERGIDIIRNHINQFVKSNSLFKTKGLQLKNELKFIILDEVDYMTKNAQQALKYLLQTTTYNVRFCLICNYISKIDDALQKEFICIRFNKLPKDNIYNLINTISINEKINLSNNTINNIIELFKTDIRGMINFIQLNQNTNNLENKIINNKTWDELHNILINTKKDEINKVIIFIQNISIIYNIDKKTIIINYLNYFMNQVLSPCNLISTLFLNIIDEIIHNEEANDTVLIKYLFYNIKL